MSVAQVPPGARDAMKRVRGYLLGSGSGDEAEHHTAPWWKVMWLSGVDYFSTLGYQPAIAFIAAGVLSPIATLLLVAVTLFAALPVYREVARRSYAGMGSIAMLERLLKGWGGKLFVLTLLGFATTDFVITMTLSAADAAQHAVENPILAPLLGGLQEPLTIALLIALAAVFFGGFREAIGMAVRVAVPYIVLNVVVIGAGLLEVFWNPQKLADFHVALAARGSWWEILLVSAFLFPKLALGMSGFETGVSVMPQIGNQGGAAGAASPLPPPPAGSTAAHVGATGPYPAGRVANTHKLLGASALLMSVMLIASSFVTSVLIPAAAFQPGGEANGRALAFLAHQLLGPFLGSIYDVFTILILWFAGASALAGLLNLIPRYLPRFGMAPWWVERPRTLVLAFLLINVIVTWVFHASVDAQGGAYATGVLVVMLSAAVAVTLAHRSEKRRSWIYFAIVTLVFGYVTVVNVLERPDGVLISAIFIAAMLTFGGLSRWQRSTELRVQDWRFADEKSERLWRSFMDKKINLVPLEHVGDDERRAKARETREYYRVEGPLVFVHVSLADDRSEFASKPLVRVHELDEPGQLEIDVTGAVAIANTIAAVSEALDPKTLFLGLTRATPMTQALKYLIWGEGEIGILVYQILLKYWRSTPEEDVRPLIFLLSD